MAQCTFSIALLKINVAKMPKLLLLDSTPFSSLNPSYSLQTGIYIFQVHKTMSLPKHTMTRMRFCQKYLSNFCCSLWQYSPMPHRSKPKYPCRIYKNCQMKRIITKEHPTYCSNHKHQPLITQEFLENPKQNNAPK